MSYESIATFSQVTSLLMFVGMFICIVAYAFWPSNGRKFDNVQRQALDLDAKPADKMRHP